MPRFPQLSYLNRIFWFRHSLGEGSVTFGVTDIEARYPIITIVFGVDSIWGCEHSGLGDLDFK